MSTKTFTVLSPLEHDGKTYRVGDAFLASDDTADPLVAVGAIADPAAARKALGKELLGSDIVPTRVRIAKDHYIPQAELVERAFAASGLTEAEWNALDDDERGERIADAGQDLVAELSKAASDKSGKSGKTDG